MIDFPQIITRDRILMNCQTIGISTKEDLFEFMTATFFNTGVIKSSEAFINDL